MLIHSAYYSVLMNWPGWSSKSLTSIKLWLVESNLKKHESSDVAKIRKLEMDHLLKHECHHVILYITQLGIDIKELLSGSGDQRMNNTVWRKISHLNDPVTIASVITRSLGGNNLQDQERALDKFKEHVTAATFKKYKKKNGAWDLEAWSVKMFKLLEQLQLFDSDTISAKQVWMDIKIMLRKAIDDFQSPVRQRSRHTDLLYADEISAKACPMSTLEDMLDTLIMTAQEEDFERGNSSKDSREEHSDDDDYDKSSKKKRRRLRSLVAIVENVLNVIPNLLKSATVTEASRLEKQTSQ